MTSLKPLSYPSLNCVLQYMDPNTRFRVGIQFPSVKTIEKRIPLKLEYLGLSFLSLKVNNHEYKLRVIKNIQDRNTEGVCDDFTDLWDANYISALTVFPGDVVIGKKSGFGPKRKDSSVAPNKMFLQLTISVSDVIQKRMHFPYKIQLHEAMKNLSTQLLGGRQGCIEARKLEIGQYETPIIRLPPGLKLKIQELVIENEALNTVKALQPIFEESSFPLKLVELRNESNPRKSEYYQHRIISTADTLKFHCFICVDREALPHFRNPSVHIKINFFRAVDFITLIQNWLANGREIGTWYSFGVQKPPTQLSELFGMLDEIANAVKETIVGMGCAMYPQCVSLPMNHYSKLVISVDEVANHNEEMAARSERPWILNMKVMDF